MNCLFVIMGATGDLTKRKIIPAVYNLMKNNKVGDFAVVGVARDRKTAKQILNRSKRFVKPKAKLWDTLLKRFYYFEADFHDTLAYSELERYIKDIESRHALNSNRLFYLATLPHHFDVITQNLGSLGRKEEGKWRRIVFEKLNIRDKLSFLHCIHIKNYINS